MLCLISQDKFKVCRNKAVQVVDDEKFDGFLRLRI